MQMQQIEEQLWSYIDGRASPEEMIFMERMIATDVVWKNQYNQLLELNKLLVKDMELEEPSMRFSKNVMEQVSRLQPARPAVQYINKKIIRSIAAIFIFTIAAFIIYGFTKIQWTTSTTSFSLPVDLKNRYTSTFNINWHISNTWINVILMVNVFLGLLVLDASLRRKKKEPSGHKITHS
jgi:magnesium-transporting ATPase (P-type)